MNFEYNKNLNYNFAIIEKLIKLRYNKIKKSNLFDLNYRDNIKIILFNNKFIFI